MEEKIFGLLGRKLGHSWSVPIHAALGCADYRLIELERSELPAFLSRQDIGQDLCDPGVSRNSQSGGTIVTCQHYDLKTHILQSFDSFAGIRFQYICRQDGS